MSRNNVFQGFHEGELAFPPTYKYRRGTDLYEVRSDKKMRAPAWCDRILWKTSRSAFSESVSLIEYKRANLFPSDHKPVSRFLSIVTSLSQT
jgi:phosphatidylinositol-bisphosphatase